MTVEQLVELLYTMPREAKVLCYVEEAEEYGETEKVVLVSDQGDMPYAKGDTPEITEPVVLIKGWIAS